MNKQGEIIVIDDDKDDQEFIVAALNELQINNKVTVFTNGKDALHYLNSHSKELFLILCDINMPVLNGIELRHKVQFIDLKHVKAAPFLYLTTASNLSTLVANKSFCNGLHIHLLNGIETLFIKLLPLVYWNVFVLRDVAVI